MTWWKRIVAWWFKSTMFVPVAIPKRFPRAACANCGRVVAQTKGGSWKHHCEEPKEKGKQR